MRAKLIYRTFSFRRTISSTIFRIGALLVAFTAIWNVRDNPLPLTLIFIGGLFFFVIAGDDEISIYEGELRISGGDLLRSWSGKGRYPLVEIALIQVDGSYGAREDLIADVIVALPGPVFPSRGYNRLTVTLRNGKTFPHRMRIYRKEIDEAMGKIPVSFSSLVVK